MNTFGEILHITIFGEPGGPAVGVVLDGLPAGEAIDENALRETLALRAPGASDLGGKEDRDEPVVLSGLLNGHTTGAPLCALLRGPAGESARDQAILRPGTADLAAWVRFRGFADQRGGGSFSFRLMAPLVLAGAVCRQLLARRGVEIAARTVQVGPAVGEDLDFAMQKEILDARASGDSVGGAVLCTADGVPAGLGGLLFGGLESRLAAMLLAIPGVKGLEFGAGFALAGMRGSAANDPLRVQDGRVVAETNHAGGLCGGFTNGMPLRFRVALAPTPTIGREQRTVDYTHMENVTARGRGRHDPCLAPRAIPVVEAVTAFCLLDAMLDGNAPAL